LLRFIPKECEYNPFILLEGIFYDVILVCYKVVFVAVLWICLFGIGSLVVCTLLHFFHIFACFFHGMCAESVN
jgi:hypothetical protein